MVAGVPHQGGAAWAVLQYLLGLKRLGHEVYFVEPVAAASLQPVGTPLPASTSAAYFRQVMAAFGLEGQAALLLAGTAETVGLPYAELCRVARRADVLLNISGMLGDARLIESVPIRAYLDLDPAFNQLWQAAQGIDMGFGGHTHFITVGGAIGHPDCPVPTCDLDWLPTWPPVVLDYWPVAQETVYPAFTTVANWRGYGSIEHDGEFYGQKAHSLRPLMALPTLTEETFMLALAIHPDEEKDLMALRQNGWQLLDPTQETPTPAAYRRFVRGSRAEFGIAKHGYVHARCGWFSDRSVCYLAAGRPVIAQDTGFSRYLPTGEGLFAFTTGDDVLAAIEALDQDPERQSWAARALAEAIFDSDKVLPQLLRQIGAA
jgi:hypothetical protein